MHPSSYLQVLIPILTLDRGPTKSAVLHGSEEEDPEEIERRVQEEHRRETIVQLLEPCLDQLEKGLTDKYVSMYVCILVSVCVSFVVNSACMSLAHVVHTYMHNCFT